MNNRPSGSIPRKTTINDQPHMLAYINPQEAMMLKSMGGAGKPGPGGIPAFYYGGDFGEGGRGAGNSGPGETGGPGQDGPEGPGVSGGGDQSPAGPGDFSPPGNQGPSQADVEKQNLINKDRAEAVQKEQVEALSSLDPVKAKTIFDYLPLKMIDRFATNLQNKTAQDQLSGKKGYNPGLFDPGGLLSGKNSKSFSHFSPVKDQNGNVVGSQAIATDGTTIGYRGQRTGSLSGSQGAPQGYVDAMNAAGQGGPPEGGQEAIFQTTASTDGTGTTPVTTNPEDFLIKNLAIRQPETVTRYEVPSIYNQGGVVSLDPFKQLRNRM